MLRKSVLLVPAVLALASSAGAAGADSPANAALAFYRVYATFNPSDGIPDAAGRKKYAPTISPALAKLLTDGDAAETRYAKANKDVPPLVEGDLFTSNFEGATSYKIGACTATAKTAACKANLVYADPHPRPQDKPAIWTDTVYLVMTPKGWRVDDIGYGATWDFGNKGKLSDTVKAAIHDAGP